MSLKMATQTVNICLDHISRSIHEDNIFSAFSKLGINVIRRNDPDRADVHNTHENRVYKAVLPRSYHLPTGVQFRQELTNVNVDCRSVQIETCDSRNETVHDVIFITRRDTLSNFCDTGLHIYGRKFRNCIQAYHWKKASDLNYQDIAEEVLYRSKYIPRWQSMQQKENSLSTEWENQNYESVMLELLNAKVQCCPDFGNALLRTGNSVLADATKSRFWSIGTDEKDIFTVDWYRWYGRNVLGEMLMSLRWKLRNNIGQGKPECNKPEQNIHTENIVGTSIASSKTEETQLEVKLSDSPGHDQRNISKKKTYYNKSFDSHSNPRDAKNSVSKRGYSEYGNRGRRGKPQHQSNRPIWDTYEKRRNHFPSKTFDRSKDEDVKDELRNGVSSKQSEVKRHDTAENKKCPDKDYVYDHMNAHNLATVSPVRHRQAKGRKDTVTSMKDTVSSPDPESERNVSQLLNSDFNSNLSLENKDRSTSEPFHEGISSNERKSNSQRHRYIKNKDDICDHQNTHNSPAVRPHPVQNRKEHQKERKFMSPERNFVRSPEGKKDMEESRVPDYAFRCNEANQNEDIKLKKDKTDTISSNREGGNNQENGRHMKHPDTGNSFKDKNTRDQPFIQRNRKKHYQDKKNVSAKRDLLESPKHRKHASDSNVAKSDLRWKESNGNKCVNRGKDIPERNLSIHTEGDNQENGRNLKHPDEGMLFEDHNTPNHATIQDSVQNSGNEHLKVSKNVSKGRDLISPSEDRKDMNDSKIAHPDLQRNETNRRKGNNLRKTSPDKGSLNQRRQNRPNKDNVRNVTDELTVRPHIQKQNEEHRKTQKSDLGEDDTINCFEDSNKSSAIDTSKSDGFPESTDGKMKKLLYEPMSPNWSPVNSHNNAEDVYIPQGAILRGLHEECDHQNNIKIGENVPIDKYYGRRLKFDRNTKDTQRREFHKDSASEDQWHNVKTHTHYHDKNEPRPEQAWDKTIDDTISKVRESDTESYSTDPESFKSAEFTLDANLTGNGKPKSKDILWKGGSSKQGRPGQSIAWRKDQDTDASSTASSVFSNTSASSGKRQHDYAHYTQTSSMKARGVQSQTKPDLERIVLRNIPQEIGNPVVKEFLKNYGVNVSGMIKMQQGAKEKQKGAYNDYNERVCFGIKPFSPLPVVAQICEHEIKIYHESQRVCFVCNQPGHRQGHKDCPAYLTCDNEEVIAFQGENDTLSNFYPCQLKMYRRIFKSSEHVYQWLKAKQLGYEALANKIYHSRHAGEAKRLSKNMSGDISDKWERERVDIMRDILKQKAKDCSAFRTTIEMSGKRILAEATSDKFWATGLFRNDTLRTDPKFWPGRNTLGILLDALRSQIITGELDKEDQSESDVKTDDAYGYSPDIDEGESSEPEKEDWFGHMVDDRNLLFGKEEIGSRWSIEPTTSESDIGGATINPILHDTSHPLPQNVELLGSDDAKKQSWPEDNDEQYFEAEDEPTGIDQDGQNDTLLAQTELTVVEGSVPEMTGEQ